MDQVKLTKGYRDRLYANYGHDFQDAGDSYDFKKGRRWGRARAYHLRRWLPTKKDAEILDLACGSGNLLQFLAENGYIKLTGVDISPDQVALAKQVTPNIIQGDVIGYLNQCKGCYDLITAYDLIEHFHKDEVLMFLDGCNAALKPGGRLILQTPNADSPWGTVHRYNDFTHEVCFNVNSLSRLLKLTNFKKIEARETGPVPWGHSLLSTIRYFVWQIIRSGLMAWNLSETGNKGSGMFTRVFLISGLRNS